MKFQPRKNLKKATDNDQVIDAGDALKQPSKLIDAMK